MGVRELGSPAADAADLPGGAARWVLVLDGNQRSALAATRSLGRRGVPVVVADETAATLAGSSRYCHARTVLPSPGRCPGAFVRALGGEVTRRGIGVVLPMTEVTMELALAHRATLGAAAVPFGTTEAFHHLTDKWRLYELAGPLGIRMPATRRAHGRAELVAVLKDIRYPVVVKPYRSRVLQGGQWRGGTVAYAESGEEALRIWSADEVLRDHPVLVQEFVEGEGRGVSCLYDRGRCVTVFGHRRIREKPPSGGVSVLSESVAVPPVMREMATRVLDWVGWHGVAMVEFKLARDGAPWLIEVNARFWGSLQLAVEAGVDFPWLLYRMATGLPEAPETTYRFGVRNRWWLGDLDHLWLTLRGRTGARQKLRSAVRFLGFGEPATRAEILRADDVRPALYELRAYTRSLRR